MRVAFITTMLDFQWGGSEELWSRSAVWLKNEGHDVSAWVPHRPQLSEKVHALAQKGISVRTYPSPPYLASRSRFLWDRLTRGTRRSYAELQRFRPDLVVISQGYNSGGFNWAAVCRKSAIPYVMIVHCNSELWWFEDQSVKDATAAYAAAQAVFGVSRSNLNLLRMQLGNPLENGEIVWNPYNVLPESIPAWPVENGRWRIACVARLEVAAKGQELLLQVLDRPEWRARPVELNFFGEGPQELALRRLAAMLELNQVHFRGYESDVRRIWQHNHLLVLPSRYEGLPLALVESMWCGRPAVVTDVGGNTEGCVDNETGFVALAPSVPLLADTLERAWDRREDWQHMGQAARAWAESQIPRDPVAVFCERLKRCAGSTGR
jgi:glycosyltransferase involved in cell wall biosynthesis